MSKTAMIRARVEPELKKNAEAVFQRLGLNATQAIMLLRLLQNPSRSPPTAFFGRGFASDF